MNFIYTRVLCPIRFRLSNYLGSLQKRFAERWKGFDPVNRHFDPPTIGRSARQLCPHLEGGLPNMAFLTGRLAEVQRVVRCLAWASGRTREVTHSLHTAVIDRQGRLAAHVEGNQFTAQQLGDLVESV